MVSICQDAVFLMRAMLKKNLVFILMSYAVFDQEESNKETIKKR